MSPRQSLLAKWLTFSTASSVILSFYRWHVPPARSWSRSLAQEHLDAVGQQKVNGWNDSPSGDKYVFFATILQGIAGFWVETHTNEDGSSEWSCGGTAYGELEYTTSKNLEWKQPTQRASKKKKKK